MRLAGRGHPVIWQSVPHKNMNPYERENAWQLAFGQRNFGAIKATACSAFVPIAAFLAVFGFIGICCWDFLRMCFDVGRSWLGEVRESNANAIRFSGRCIVFLCSIAAASASDVTLAWDPSPAVGCTYVLYATTNSTLTETNMSKAQVIIDCGTNLQVVAAGMATPGTWRFGATAKVGGVQSDLSNILILSVPQAPSSMRTVALQYSGNLEGLGTNPTSLFFRLKLVP